MGVSPGEAIGHGGKIKGERQRAIQGHEGWDEDCKEVAGPGQSVLGELAVRKQLPGFCPESL